MAKTGGRPSKYTQDLADEICIRLATGESLRSICKDDHIPHIATIMTWVFKNVKGTESFHEQYETARKMQAENLTDEIADIADNGNNDWMEANGDSEGYRVNGEAIQRSRLRVDTRKWIASKILTKYRDKTTTEHTGTINLTNLSDQELEDIANGD